MTIRVFFEPIYRMTGSGNVAIAAFVLFQIGMMALAFSYMMISLHKGGMRDAVLISFIVLRAIMPYHIGMSCAVEKDTMWAVFVSIFATALYRRINHLDKSDKLSTLIYGIGVMGTSLYRSNGTFVVAILLLVMFLWLLGKRKDRVLGATVKATFVFLLLSLLMNRAYLSYKNIPQPDTVESLSIPLQQIGRVLFDKRELNEQEEEFLELIVSTDAIREVYNSSSSDNIKNLIRREGNQEYLSDHMGDFIKLWMHLGLRYPYNYLKAWVDETRGYWAPSGYYSIWDIGISERVDLIQYGIYNTTKNQSAMRLWEKWNELIALNKIPFFEIILSCGIRFWSLLFMALWMFRNNDKNALLAVIPALIVFSLWIATPTSNMFRYVYAVYAMFPVAVMSVCSSKNDTKTPSPSVIVG
ncbi:MAG: DUF6020 family protein [Lachnospiraceae bacterium]|nr:DUF6020 family protein [Lachnospiraceae bacterium]